MNEKFRSPLVSVVIPYFNARDHIAETINSVIDQTFKDLEIIIVDDGSTDNTFDIIQSFGSRIKSFRWENRGASAARNKGTELSSGEYIQYLDSDDLLLPSAIEKRIEVFNKTNADVVYSSWQELIEDKSGAYQKGKVKDHSLEDIHSNIEIALFTKFWAPPAAYLFRSRLVKKIGGFREGLKFGEDARFVFDLAAYGAKFAKIQQVGAYYRMRQSGNLSKSDPVNFLKDVYLNTCDIESLWKNRGALDSDKIEALIQNYDYTARNLFQSDYKLFRENLESLYKVQPGFRLTWPKVAGVLSKTVGYRAAALMMKHFFPLKKNIS